MFDPRDRICNSDSCLRAKLDRMKFSLLIECQIASPTPASERQAFHDCIAQVLLADELGYHGIWAVEHHGLYEYSHCSAPEVPALLYRGQQRPLRVGHAVTLTPYRYNHPIRVAERIATLDILSGGRVRWGSGKSAPAHRAERFEIDRDESIPQYRRRSAGDDPAHVALGSV